MKCMLTCAISMAPHNEGKDGLKLYVAQPEGPLHAVDADSGRPLWPMPFGAAVKGGSHAGVVQAHTMPGLSTSNRCGKTLPQPFGVTPTALNISLPSVWKQQTKGYEIHVLPFMSCV